MIFGNKNLKIATNFLQENKDGLRNFLEFFKNYDNDSLQSVLDILKTSHGSINGIIGSLAKIDDDLKKSEIDKLKTAIDSINSILRNRELSNDIVSRMVQNVEISATSFYARLSENKSSKLIIKKLITSVPKVHEILRNDKAIFIEAGSTLSYVALSLIDRAFQIRQQLPHITTEDILTTIEPLAISTNNPLIYMISLYEHHIDPTLLQGKPRNHYGATYGDPKHRVINNFP